MSKKKTVGLSMIVKNESQCIERLLGSVYGHIDYWAIVDTGSTDGTQDIVQNFFKSKGVPGQLIQTEWVDFATCRNIALDAIEKVVDYGFTIDADEIFITEKKFSLQDYLKKGLDKYYLHICQGNNAALKLPFWKTGRGFRWIGPVHECLKSDYKTSATFIHEAKIIYTQDGDSWKQGQKEKYTKYAQILEEYCKQDNDPRWVYYTGCCYQCAGDFKKAHAWFKRRSQLNGNREELYQARFMMGLCAEQLNLPADLTASYFHEAHLVDKQRAEPIYRIIRIYQKAENWKKAYEFSKLGLRYNRNPPPPLRLESPILYQYKMLELHAISCINTGQEQEGHIVYWKLRKQIAGLNINPRCLQHIIQNEKFFTLDKRA